MQFPLCKKAASFFLISFLIFNQAPSASAAFLEQSLNSDQLKAKSLSDSVFHSSELKAKMLPMLLAYPAGEVQCRATPGDHSGHPPETSHQSCTGTPQNRQSQDSSPKDSSCDNRCQEKLFKESQEEQRQKAYEKAKEDAENTGQCNKEILSKEDCQNAQESYQRNQKLAKDYQGLSGVGRFGYVSSIALGVLTGVAGVAGIISYAALGGPALALALGIPGLVFGLVFTPLSAAVPSSFHEGFGATLLTPLALGWGMISGPISVISGGWGTLPSFGSENKTVDSYFKHLHTAAQIAGTAATLAAGGTLLAAGALPLAGSAVTIPAASSIASAITPAGAIAAGSAVIGGGIAWGIKELALHVGEKSKEAASKKQKNTKDKETVSQKSGGREALKQKKEPPAPISQEKAREIRELTVKATKKFVDKPYAWGGCSLHNSAKGLDCSGFAYQILFSHQPKQTKTSAQGYYKQAEKLDAILPSDALPKPGDIFFKGNLKNINHIGFLESCRRTGDQTMSCDVIHANGSYQIKTPEGEVLETYEEVQEYKKGHKITQDMIIPGSCAKSKKDTVPISCIIELTEWNFKLENGQWRKIEQKKSGKPRLSQEPYHFADSLKMRSLKEKQ